MNESVGWCEESGTSGSDALFRFVTHGVLLNAMGALGLLGNALAVLVLSRPQMRSSINCLLVGLAGCDTAVILTSVLLFGLTAIYPYTGRLRYYYYHVSPHITPFVFPLALVAQTMSVYLTVLVTVERWVAVCHPFRAKALCTSARARWYVFGTALFAFAYNVPHFFEVEVYSESIANGTDVIYCLRASGFRNDTYVMVYIHWMYFIVMYFIPFTVLAILNTCIVRQVQRAQAERARLSRVQRRELSLTTMLLVVVLVFVICNIMPLAVNVCEVFFPDFFAEEGEDSEFHVVNALVKINNLTVMINSSVNFVIYVIFGGKFKRVFLTMFCVGRLRRGPSRSSPDHTREESLGSYGERLSLRLSRHGTLRRSGAPRAPPTVYLPARTLSARSDHTDVTLITSDVDAPVHT